MRARVCAHYEHTVSPHCTPDPVICFSQSISLVFNYVSVSRILICIILTVVKALVTGPTHSSGYNYKTMSMVDRNAIKQPHYTITIFRQGWSHLLFTKINKKSLLDTPTMLAL